ncbi:MAG: LPXTG cell wall anchor domain-containing protein [Lachnospiraceae bacterium]|nr:LPXTG cell wall anchor domain-containing protein [Lachnospiraceae bacterium]
MKKMKKILAFVMAMAMVLGMSVTALAANGDGHRDEDDTATVTITGIDPVKSDEPNVYPTVTLYRIAKGEYDSDFKGYSWATGVNQEVKDGNIVLDVAAVAGKLQAGTITQLTEVDNENDNGVVSSKIEKGTFTAEVHAGAYIAIISGGGKTVYNPILLTATYGENGADLVGGSVGTGDTYNSLYGSSAVTKKSSASVDKTVNVPNDQKDGEKNTASVGDVVDYTITPEMPSYPASAVNKTVYITDQMSAGLTFDFETLKVLLDGTAVSSAYDTAEGKTDVKVFKNSEDKEIARAIKVNNGFRLTFNYDNLEDKTTGGIPTNLNLTVTYSAVLNDNAVVGSAGNTNEVKMHYTNNPSKGESYKDPEKPEPTDPEYEDVTDEDTEDHTVYSYQLAFKKVDAENNTTTLKDAVFGIYAEGTEGVDGTVVESSLVDVVTTNESGYAVSSKVAKGDYYVKELTAPNGYSLSSTVTKVTVDYATATKTTTATVRIYTATDNGTPQVGWLRKVDNVDTFCQLSEYKYKDGKIVDSNDTEVTGVTAAYIGSETRETNVVQTTETAGAGTVLLGGEGITNTKLSSLPSTGGIGTTIFTIGGCAIMILAAGLYFASRRKSAK